MARRYVLTKATEETISDANTPASSSGSVLGLLGGLANRLRAITGKGSWTQTPDANLADAATHHADRTNIHQVTHAQTSPAAVNPADTNTARNRHLSNADAKGWEDHRNATGNVHGATAAQVQARPDTWVPGWADVTGKPTAFTPSAHKASHVTGAADALAPADIGAAPSSHVGSRDGHPLATATQNGLYPAPDKAKLDTLAAPQRVYTPPAFGEVTLNVTSNGWQPMMPSPEISVPALGDPPAGFKWLLDIEGGIRINPPAANTSIFLQIQFDRAAVGSSVEGGGTLFASSQGALPVFRYGAPPPATNRSFTVNFYWWTVVQGSYGIRGGPYPACRAYLVAA